MANGLFIPSFRGAGSPGAPGVGTTQQAILQGQQQRQQAAAATARSARFQQLIGGVQNSQNPNNSQAIAQIAVEFPEQFDQLNQNLGLISQQQKDEAADFAFNLRNTPFANRDALIQQRVGNLQVQGRNPADTADLIGQSEIEQNQGLETAQIAALSPEKRLEIAKGGGGLASAKTEILESGATIQALPDGSVTVRNPSGDVVDGQERLDALAEARQANIETKEKESDIAVSRAQRVARATQRERRVSDITQEIATRNRNSKRGAVKINEALTVASKASQGLAGAAKLKLSSLVPGIDVTDEALLDQSLKQLAVDQLQAFKGPTTDFEFGVVQNTTGEIGDSRTANIARLKSLKRAGWFNEREFQQLKRHTNAGGDPDSFAFNFGESIKTKKGVFTLQDIQDTAVDNNFTIEETIKALNR